MSDQVAERLRDELDGLIIDSGLANFLECSVVTTRILLYRNWREKVRELYEWAGTYEAVGAILGEWPSTVRKWILNGKKRAMEQRRLYRIGIAMFWLLTHKRYERFGLVWEGVRDLLPAAIFVEEEADETLF